MSQPTPPPLPTQGQTQVPTPAPSQNLISPVQLQPSFDTAFRGYDTDEVNVYINDVAKDVNARITTANATISAQNSQIVAQNHQNETLMEQLEQANTQIENLHQKIDKLKNQLAANPAVSMQNSDAGTKPYAQLGATAQRIIDEANESAKSIRDAAAKDYDTQLANARDQATRIMAQARESRDKIEERCKADIEASNKNVILAADAYKKLRDTIANSLAQFDSVNIDEWKRAVFDPQGTLLPPEPATQATQQQAQSTQQPTGQQAPVHTARSVHRALRPDIESAKNNAVAPPLPVRDDTDDTSHKEAVYQLHAKQAANAAMANATPPKPNDFEKIQTTDNFAEDVTGEAFNTGKQDEIEREDKLATDGYSMSMDNEENTTQEPPQQNAQETVNSETNDTESAENNTVKNADSADNVDNSNVVDEREPVDHRNGYDDAESHRGNPPKHAKGAKPIAPNGSDPYGGIA